MMTLSITFCLKFTDRYESRIEVNFLIPLMSIVSSGDDRYNKKSLFYVDLFRVNVI